MSKRPANINTSLAVPSSRSQSHPNTHLMPPGSSTASSPHSASSDPLSRPLFTPHGVMLSPNIQQPDVPPALSPLDAIAIQSRLLAKKFEEETESGRRLSRLPPITVASEFAKARPGYFRSMTTGSHTLGSPVAQTPTTVGIPVEDAIRTPPGTREETERRPSGQAHQQLVQSQQRSGGRSRDPIPPQSQIQRLHYPQVMETPRGFGVSSSGAGAGAMNVRPPPQTMSAPSRPHPHSPGFQHRPQQASRPLEYNFPEPRAMQRVGTPVGNASNMINTPQAQSPQQMYHSVHVENESPVRGRMTMGINTSPPLPPAGGALLGTVETPPSYTIGPSLRTHGATQSNGINTRANPPSPLYMGNSTIRPVADQESVEKQKYQHGLEQSIDGMSLSKPQPHFHQLVQQLQHHQSQQMMRSPSIISEVSLSSTPPRPSLNYSRPISRQSHPSMDFKIPRSDSPPLRKASGQNFSRDFKKPSLDIVYRQDSADATTTTFPSNLADTPQTPVSMESDIDPDMFHTPEQRRPPASSTTSYVYTKYTIGGTPRDKHKSVALDDFIKKQFNWNDSNTDIDITLPFEQHPFLYPSTPPSPVLVPLSEPRRPFGAFHKFGSTPSLLGSPRSSSDRPRRKLTKARPGTANTTASSAFTASTIKPAPRAFLAEKLAGLSAEEHLARGITFHEENSLQKSTYHLRLAAKAGHPTGMLLYALACRHGWGMKPNAADGVTWLRKAVEGAQLEVAEDEDVTKQGGVMDNTEKKVHEARFALSVFELGQSYMNGWGVKEDRALALRCFEVAGNWGDADALAEAARCYMDGIGCKKDLKKSARLYRKAEEKGVKVAGNSWIHKEKYDSEREDEDVERGRASRQSMSDSRKQEKEHKREKSRTRAFFSMRKSNAS